MSHDDVQIGVFGGSGFYSLIEKEAEIKVDTPFGQPSDRITIGSIKGVRTAFMPRHGANHQYPPHMINYRANLWSMKKLGVKRVIAPGACGSLNQKMKPGDFVFCDQFIDKTYGRASTFYDGPVAVHISTDEPYCRELRGLGSKTAQKLGISYHDAGTAVIIQGPRFSTKAESQLNMKSGWHVVNMTQYPEVVLARELKMCYLNISLITDWDAGFADVEGIEPVTGEEIGRVFKENNEKMIEILFNLVPMIPEKQSCDCATSLEKAVISNTDHILR